MTFLDALLDFLLNFYGPGLYWLIFGVLLACGLGLPIPEDITLFCGGILAYFGLTDVWVMILVCFAGVMIGDSFVFWIGSRYGRRLAKKGILKKLLHEERMDYIRDHLLLKHGNKIIFSARFMPGFRAPLFFTAGTLHVPFRVFLFYDGLAALISVPLIVYAVYYFGGELEYVVSKIKSIEQFIIALIVGGAIFALFKWLKSRRKSEGL